MSRGSFLCFSLCLLPLVLSVQFVPVTTVLSLGITQIISNRRKLERKKSQSNTRKILVHREGTQTQNGCSETLQNLHHQRCVQNLPRGVKTTYCNHALSRGLHHITSRDSLSPKIFYDIRHDLLCKHIFVKILVFVSFIFEQPHFPVYSCLLGN